MTKININTSDSFVCQDFETRSSSHTRHERASERNPSFLCTPRMLLLARAAPLHSLAGKFAAGNSPLSSSFPSI
ncbi:hypothetical protein Ahy_A04g018270 isoform B [Arachis hypogaea]|uniref:Uncharacterized protein n=1 Tax=Arachis hypogaea TaxID=3818 RepID=A0A445DD87_ARAHY|nr:hypothetical protein Ahy_A04g018270 isoform B [Arachis hypogaea]